MARKEGRDKKQEIITFFIEKQPLRRKDDTAKVKDEKDFLYVAKILAKSVVSLG